MRVEAQRHDVTQCRSGSTAVPSQVNAISRAANRGGTARTTTPSLPNRLQWNRSYKPTPFSNKPIALSVWKG